jgi:thioredoxin:protein disulfide reductase
MIQSLLRHFLVGCVLLVTIGGSVEAQLMRPRAELTPLVAHESVAAGGEARLALRVTLPETLHVNSDVPRDPALIPTRLTIDPPAGVTVTEIVYPEASDLAQAGQDELLAVFGHTFVIGVRVTLSGDLPAGDLHVPARLRYQACDDQICYLPANADTSWTLQVGPAGTATSAQHREVFDAIAFGQGQAPPAAAPTPTAAPVPTTAAVPTTSAAPTAAPAQGPAAGSGGPLPADDPHGFVALERFTVQGNTGGYLSSAEFLRFIDNAEQGVRERGLLEGRGLLAMLLVVFVGGLALNLTPCVLPMIPINLAIIGAGAAAGSRRRGFLLGSTYGSAMAVVYGVLGVVVILTAGTFGAINASPWFNAGIAAVFVVLGLAMFDVLLIDFSRFMPAVGAGAPRRGTFALAFSMGAVAALLAGACVAPVVIQVVLFASDLYASGNTLALALPFVLGLGMALPWPIAGAGIAALPKPGMWMVRVKQAFGVLILATAAYYGYLAYTLFANRWVDPAAVQASMEAKLEAGWHASLAEGLAVAEREQKPVLVDLWATWCKNCLTMDSTTFADPEVVAALDGYVKIKLQAEDPDDPVTRQIMQRFNAVGLPTYVVLHP